MSKKIKNWSLTSLNIPVFGFCLGLSILFWLFSNLSDDRKVYVNFELDYINTPVNYVLANDLPSELLVELESIGFDLLKFDLNKENRLEINLDKIKFSVGDSIKKGLWYGSQYKNEFLNQLGTKMEVLKIFPDTIHFSLEREITKKVPFKVKNDLVSGKGVKVANIITKPDSLVISGPISQISTYKEYPILLKGKVSNQDSIHQSVKIKFENQITSSLSKVKVIIEQELLVQQKIKIPLSILNQSKNQEITLFPASVEVSFFCTNTQLNSIDLEDFKMEIDMIQYQIDPSVSRLDITPRKFPDFVENLKLDRGKVEFIVKEND